MEDFSSPEDEEWKKRRGVSKDKGRSDREAGSGTFLHWNLGGAPLSRAGHSTGAVTVTVKCQSVDGLTLSNTIQP